MELSPISCHFIVPSPPIHFTLMIEAMCSSESLFLTRDTYNYIPEDYIFIEMEKLIVGKLEQSMVDILFRAASRHLSTRLNAKIKEK
jgi:hypothetical protein